MTEPPRPPGAGEPDPASSDPTAPLYPPASPSSGGSAAPGSPHPGPYPPSGPTSGGYPPPAAPSGGGYQPPTGGDPSGSGYPPGGYPPGGGYGAGPAPAGFANNEDKTWALVAHFGGAAGMLVGGGCAGWIAPLVALLAQGSKSPTVRAHAIAALNFQVLWSIIAVVGWILTCILIGPLISVAAMIVGIVFGVIAGIKANEGQLARYPMTISLIK